MRSPKHKAKLKSYVLEGDITSEGSDCIRVADGGALLWSISDKILPLKIKKIKVIAV